MKLTNSMVITKKESKGKSGWGSIIWVLLIMISGGLVGHGIYSLLRTSFPWLSTDPTIMGLFGFPFILMIGLAFNKYYYGRSNNSLGFVNKNIGLNYVQGLALGLGMISLVYVINYFGGAVTSTSNSSFKLVTVIGLFIAFGIQGMTEEVLFRGLLMNEISSKKGIWLGMVVNSLVFSVVHGANPNTSLLALINIFICGMMFSLLFYLSDNMWLTGAFHSMWNFFMGTILGLEVSGQKISGSLLVTKSISGKELISGAEFGFEGGLVVTVVGLIFCVTFYQLKVRQSR